MTLCKGLTPGVTRGYRRTNAHAQRCGALAEPGVDYCAAHAKLAGLLRCPLHGWVTPLYRHGHVTDSSILFACPRFVEASPCRVGWNARKEPVDIPPPIMVPIGQAGE